MTPRLFGADYSVYVRIVRMALAEKGVAYELVPVDIFAEGGPPAWYRNLHPFGRIPAFQHDALMLFETSAICRYVDEAFDGPSLQASTPACRAAMNQIIGLLDAYAYRAMVWDIYVERCSKPAEGKTPDEDRIASALPIAATVLETLARLKGDRAWLAGDGLTLADLHAAPMLGYFSRAPEGHRMLTTFPTILTWWDTVRTRPSYLASEPMD